MSFAHLTLPTREVERTTQFLEQAFRYRRNPVPANVPAHAQWLDIGHQQEIHVFYVEGFVVSPFEQEFGRHVALFHPISDFDALKTRLVAAGAELVAPLRDTPYARFFFREPINGYFFEVIDEARQKSVGT